MEVLLSDIWVYIRNTKNYISLSDFIVEDLEGIFPPIGSLIDYYTEINGHRDNRTLIISGYGFDSKGNALLKGHNRNWKLVSRNGQKSKGLVIYGDFSIEYCKNMLKEYNIKSSLIYWEEEVKDMSKENKLTLKIGSDGNIQNCVIGTILN